MGRVGDVVTDLQTQFGRMAAESELQRAGAEALLGEAHFAVGLVEVQLPRAVVEVGVAQPHAAGQAGLAAVLAQGQAQGQGHFALAADLHAAQSVGVALAHRAGIEEAQQLGARAGAAGVELKGGVAEVGDVGARAAGADAQHARRPPRYASRC